MRMCLECHRKYCREQIAERRRRARWAGRLTVEAETHDDLHRWEARRLAQVKRDHARIAAITDEYRPAGGGR